MPATGGDWAAAQTEHRTVDTPLFADVLGGERWPYDDYWLD